MKGIFNAQIFFLILLLLLLIYYIYLLLIQPKSRLLWAAFNYPLCSSFSQITLIKLFFNKVIFRCSFLYLLAKNKIFFISWNHFDKKKVILLDIYFKLNFDFFHLLKIIGMDKWMMWKNGFLSHMQSFLLVWPH